MLPRPYSSGCAAPWGGTAPCLCLSLSAHPAPRPLSADHFVIRARASARRRRADSHKSSACAANSASHRRAVRFGPSMPPERGEAARHVRPFAAQRDTSLIDVFEPCTPSSLQARADRQRLDGALHEHTRIAADTRTSLSSSRVRFVLDSTLAVPSFMRPPPVVEDHAHRALHEHHHHRRCRQRPRWRRSPDCPPQRHTLAQRLRHGARVRRIPATALQDSPKHPTGASSDSEERRTQHIVPPQLLPEGARLLRADFSTGSATVAARTRPR